MDNEFYRHLFVPLRRQVKRFRHRNWAKHALPPRMVFVLAPPRSGSTWLSDAIRCHPEIEFSKSAVIYRELGLVGRRYPRALSSGNGATNSVEVLPGKLENIPSFAHAKELFAPVSPDTPTDIAYAIEKFHPEFYDFKTKLFLSRLSKLESEGVQIKMVYLIRNPEETIKSFVGYQIRDPSWHPSLFKLDPYKYMEQSFYSIYQVARERPGLVIDYTNVFRDMSTELEKVYSYLWPQQGSNKLPVTRNICLIAAKETARELRDNLGTTFLGQNKISDHKETDSTALHNRQYMALSNTYYRDLLAQ